LSNDPKLLNQFDVIYWIVAWMAAQSAMLLNQEYDAWEDERKGFLSGPLVSCSAAHTPSSCQFRSTSHLLARLRCSSCMAHLGHCSLSLRSPPAPAKAHLPIRLSFSSSLASTATSTTSYLTAVFVFLASPIFFCLRWGWSCQQPFLGCPVLRQ
jgi:hypothetical protein